MYNRIEGTHLGEAAGTYNGSPRGCKTGKFLQERECTKRLGANMESRMLQYAAHTGSPGVQRALDIVSRLRMLPAHGTAVQHRRSWAWCSRTL